MYYVLFSMSKWYNGGNLTEVIFTSEMENMIDVKLIGVVNVEGMERYC